MRRALIWAAALASSLEAPAHTTRPRTYCNPLDLDYQYIDEPRTKGTSYRSGADPVILLHKGEYYLFETLAGGYWRSKDLARWTHVKPEGWPEGDAVAPAALSVGEKIYFMASTFEPAPIYSLTPQRGSRLDVENPRLPPLPRMQAPNTPPPGPPGSVPPGPWDPQFFHDQSSGRWFLYWNSSNVYPLYGIELDPMKGLAYVGEPQMLLRLDPRRHGWERFGEDHRDTTIDPYIEGAWMTKHEGRYYLQYAAPGTEYNVYANGTYVGPGPLGPFEYAPYNPVSYKPGGFATGAGHGNTFQDVFGNYWNTGTNWIGYNWKFERRIVMFPAGFDRDGQMYANTRFGDFPHWTPSRKWKNSHELFTGWMLLSYRKQVKASSTLDDESAANVTDENPRTFWVAGRNRPGETLTIDLGRELEVKALQVNYADYRSERFKSDERIYTAFRVAHSRDGQTWSPMADLSGDHRDRPNAYVELPRPVRTRYVRYEHVYVGAATLAIADLRIFGNSNGGPPAAPAGFTARRHVDARDATVSWTPVAGVVGYNVRWGIAPDKLYQTYQVFADRPPGIEIRALNIGVDYFAAIEAFDENGVSVLSPVVPIR